MTAPRRCVSLLLLVLAAVALRAADDEDLYRRRRQQMVAEAIEREGVTNEAVLKSMRSVPRHQFVASELKDKAYFDQALPIGHKQTISPPFIVAYMTQMIDPQPTDAVLEIGTGSGYQAAVLSSLVRQVYSIEIVEPLGKQAAERLARLGYKNVHTKVGDGYQGWPEQAPFDKIIVTCSPEKVPQPLVDQLREGGKMIIPLGERYQQVFYLLEKKDGELVRKQLLPALFVPMTGISEEKREVLPDAAKPQLRNGDFELRVPETDRPAGWHYQRQLTLATENAPSGETFAEFKNVDRGRHAQCLQGMGLDGRKIGAIRVRLWVRGVRIQKGDEKWEQASLAVQFFDANRKPIGDAAFPPWEGSFAWRQVTKELPVPPAAREAILMVGLNGATGELAVDDIDFVPLAR